MTDGRPSLTLRQAKALSILKQAISQNGVAPSYNELLAHLGFRSKSAVHRALHRLEERGYIKITPNRKRAIEIVWRECPHCGGAL